MQELEAVWNLDSRYFESKVFYQRSRNCRLPDSGKGGYTLRMSTFWHLFPAAIITGAALCTQVQAKGVTCHLHAPNDYPTFSKQPLLIPAVGNQFECDQLNLRQFSSRGRCHCTQGSMSAEDNGFSDFSRPLERQDLLP